MDTSAVHPLPTRTLCNSDTIVLKSDCRTNPKEIPEPAVDLLGLDAVESRARGAGSAGNELDLFGPMVSNPLPSSNNTQQAQPASSSAPVQVETSSSSTFTSSTSTSTTTATTKVMEKKLLSKDSILSLYASSSVGGQPPSQRQQPASGQGACMVQPSIQGFAPAMGGGIQPTTMMGGGAMMSGMTLPNGGYVGMQPVCEPPSNQGQNAFNVQQQQGQCNMNQMAQQMSGVALSGGGPPGAPPASGWPVAQRPASGQTLSTQLWK